MSAAAKRILFQVRNRRGLGHMMRGLNIARALRELDPGVDILFYLRTPPAEGMWSPEVRYVVESDPDSLAHWPQVLQEFRPDVVVYDTMLPRDPANEPVVDSARYAYIMRKCLEDKQREVFASPFLARMSACIVPHVPEQFGYEVPERLRARTRFVGPIVRLPDAAAQAALRGKYGVAPGDFLLTSTVGGGGFEAQADAFFAVVFEAHRRLQGAVPNLRHLVVQGPNYAGTLVPLPGMTVVAVEPEMINLLAISDLVIAEGGYNTVNEIRVTRTPAIFLPSERGNDDQEERVRALERAGLGFVFAPAEGAAVAAKVLELYRDPSALAAIRERYASDRAPLGNRAAAELLLELARR
ncbi:MAG TPA: glycosyltransferase [Burkholderiales bacterium]|nr:glycosyltransferase [Burkholderiales bacterium]